jgi:hypothetical protein
MTTYVTENKLTIVDAEEGAGVDVAEGPMSSPGVGGTCKKY